MNETFRISEAALRAHRKQLAFLPVFALGVVAFQFYRTPTDLLMSVVVAATVVGVSVVVAIRQYKPFAKYAATHSLTMCEDFMLFRDGEVETRMPYSCIKGLTVTGTLRQARAVTLEYSDRPKELLYGYEQFSRVLELLLEKTPNAPMRTRGLLIFNRAFKDRRG
jgi:hypothetical protein